MKPTTPIDTEMVFLRDVERRLQSCLAHLGRNPTYGCLPDVLGLQSALNCRIAEVTKLRDKENDTCQQERSPNANA